MRIVYALSRHRKSISWRRHPLRRLAALAAALSCAAMSSLVLAAAAPAAAGTAPTSSRPAAVTTAPAPASHFTKKPTQARRSAPADCLMVLYSFTATSGVSISTDSSSELIANTTCDVGPTPWYIQIYDATTGSLVASCGIGTSCSAFVRQSVPTTHGYVDYLDYGNTAFPQPANQTFARRDLRSRDQQGRGAHAILDPDLRRDHR